MIRGCFRIRAWIGVACVAGSCLAGYATATKSEAKGTHGVEGPEALEGLDYAFRFASAIYNDDKDRAKAQQAVVRDFVELGALDEASTRASSIEGWRRAVVLADLARALAAAGQIEESRQAIAEAQRLRREITDFHGPRVDHHVAQAMAAMGEFERSYEIIDGLATADRLQYLGKAIAARAETYASEGKFDAAMDSLGEVDVGEEGIDDLAWWRTQGYLKIAGRTELTREQRLAALTAAEGSLGAVSDSRHAEGLLAIAAAYRELEDPRGSAIAALEAAEALVGRIPDHYPTKPNELAGLARVWAEIGESDRARALLNQAETLIPVSQPIEQPGFFAWVACSYLVLGDMDEAVRVYERALSVAETLVNPRPRALAFVAIGRSMGLHGLTVPDTIRPRLDAALVGLRPPEAGGAS